MSRTGNQWVEATGGFRFGETPEQFQARAKEIGEIEAQMKRGEFSPESYERLKALKGLPDDEWDYEERD